MLVMHVTANCMGPCSLVKSSYSAVWRQTWKDFVKEHDKQTYYFSIEYLPGKLLKSNLLNMG